jgi:imidazoleglycerol-phosphate dehydratase/histidinol-phosphatase
MKPLLLIDRDGTLIVEPPDEQIDSLEKLEFYPGVFSALSKIVAAEKYDLVMVTNQDGLGSASFPEDSFWPAHNKMLQAFKNEGITFSEILIDRSLPHENKVTRKPGTGLLAAYMKGQHDLANSYVIGDRTTDVQLARNLGAKAILLGGPDKKAQLENEQLNEHCVLVTASWKDIERFLNGRSRTAVVSRRTKETNIEVELNLDGLGNSKIATGLGFFDHMLEQIARHGLVDLSINVKGDLQIDEHHTIEDTALALGEALLKALGTKQGIERYGFCLPMDDALAQVAIDFGGRPWTVWEASFSREKIGDMPTEMFFHFFKSLSDSAKCNINIKAEGQNEHHKIESIFKAFAKAMKMAVRSDGTNNLPTTKGIL